MRVRKIITHSEGCNRSKTQSFVTTEVGIAKERPKQGGEIGGAIEDVEESGGCDALHVEHRG